MAYNQFEYTDPEDEATKISKINSAGLINQRMHNLWNDSNNHKRKGAFSLWNGDLDAIWCELGGDVKEGEDEDKKFNELNESISKVSPLVNWEGHFGFNLPSKDQMLTKAKQYQLLMKKELFLRRLQNKQGKGTAYVQEEDDWD